MTIFRPVNAPPRVLQNCEIGGSGKKSRILSQVHLILEATGVYHEAATLWFIEAGVGVSVVNPAQVKALGQGVAVRTKTDARDSQVLACYGALVNPPPWQPPAPEIRELQALMARLEAVEADLRREPTRLEKTAAVPAPATVLDSLQQHLAFLRQEQTRVQTAIHDHIDRRPRLKQDHDVLGSIPAVGEKTAQRLLLGHLLCLWPLMIKRD